MLTCSWKYGSSGGKVHHVMSQPVLTPKLANTDVFSLLSASHTKTQCYLVWLIETCKAFNLLLLSLPWESTLSYVINTVISVWLRFCLRFRHQSHFIMIETSVYLGQNKSVLTSGFIQDTSSRLPDEHHMSFTPVFSTCGRCCSLYYNWPLMSSWYCNRWFYFGVSWKPNVFNNP